MPYMLLVSV